MAAPKIIKSTDPNVPVMTAVSGQAITWWNYISAALGWEKVFAGDKKAVYRPGASMGNSMFIRVDDTVNGSYLGTSRCLINTYESMSDIDTGSGKSGDIHMIKSWQGNTPIKWEVIGDSYGFHLFSELIVRSPPGVFGQYFGEGERLFEDDMWFTLVAGIYPGSSDIGPEFYLLCAVTATLGTVNYGIRCARNRAGDAGSIGAFTALYANGLCVDLACGASSLPQETAYTGKLVYTRPYFNNGGVARTLRGYLPGLYCPEHKSGLVDRRVYPDGNRQLMAIRVFNRYSVDASLAGYILIDIGEGFRA